MLFSLVFSALLVLINGNAQVKIPPAYVQQDQHTAFFLFGFDGQSMISHCHMNWAPGYPRCYLEFEREKNQHTNIFFDYNALEKVHPVLLKALKNLHARLLRERPVSKWNLFTDMFRENDYEVLAELIRQIEAESLSNRFLMPNIPRKIESISNTYVVNEIMNVFELILLAHEIRQ